MGFETKFRAEFRPPNSWVLTKPLVYASAVFGRIVVPAGFDTDLASIPQGAQSFISKVGRHTAPSVVHDWLYVSASVRNEDVRKRADQIFLEAMHAEGVGWWTRSVMYRAVRDFGAAIFYRKR